MRYASLCLGTALWLACPAFAEDATSDDAEPDDTDSPSEETPDEGDGASAPTPPPVIRLRPPDEPVPSALDDLARGEASVEQRDVRLPPRSTAFVRPRLSGWLHAGEDSPRLGMGLGVTLGQRWWPLAERRVAWSGENRLVAEGLVGAARGWRLVGTSTVGPWLGRVGVRLGPLVEASGLRAGDDVLDATVLIGGELTIAADLGGLHPWVGFGTAWDVLGRRDKALKLPTLGTESEWQVGVAVASGWLVPRAEVRVRGTAIGPLATAVLGVQIRPPLSLRDPPPWSDADDHPDDEERP